MTEKNTHFAVSKKSFKNIPSFIGKKINDMFWGLGKNAFTFMLIFMLLGVVWGEFLFYKYIFLVQIKETVVVDNSVKFHEDIYTAVMQELQERQEYINK